MIKRLRLMLRPLALILFYLLVALIALNALAANFTTAMPGTLAIQPTDQIQPSEFDIFAWDLWWVRHAVFDLHVSPLYTNYLIYPFTSPLAGHTLALLWGFVSAPFQMVFGLISAFNGIIILSFVLAASLMYAFVRRHVQRQSIAVLAGLIYAFTPAMLHRASVGHIDKLSIFWLPLILLAWDKVIATRRWTWAVMTGLAMWFAWLTDFQQAMWALLLWMPYAIYTLTLRPFPVRERVGVRVGWLMLAIVAFVIPSLFAPLPQLIEANRLNYPPARLEDTVFFAFPLQNFLIPGDNGDFSIGLLLPILTLLSTPFIRRDGRSWFWLIVAIGCFILALGPYIDIGSTRVPLPYSIVHQLLGNQYRTPMRFATPGVFALTMFVSLSLDRAFASHRLDVSLVTRTCPRLRATRPLAGTHRTAPTQWVQVWRGGQCQGHSLLVTRYSLLVSGLIALFILDYRLLQPFPITIMPDYQIYRTLANDRRGFTVLEVPIGVRTGFAIVGRGEYLQYYAPIHQHPIPSGYLSRLPTEITNFFYNDPLIGALTLSHAFPPMAEVDAELSAVIHDWKIGYVILHRDMLEPGRVRSFGNLLNRQPLLERVGEEGPLVVYRAKDLSP